MKLVKILGGLLAVIVLAKIFVFPDYRHRFRLTIEFDTPDGIKSASGVHEVVREDTIIDHYRYSFRGDAIYLDLGRGKHVIALLAHGPTADFSSVLSMGVETFFPNMQVTDSTVWSGRPPAAGLRQLPDHLIPTMVRFADLSRPESARVVFGVGSRHNASPFVTDNAEGELGAGYRFRRATIEMVHGKWPFDVLGLYGHPVTRGIENRLLWWNRAGWPAYQAHLAMKNGDRTGPSSRAEYLFKW